MSSLPKPEYGLRTTVYPTATAIIEDLNIADTIGTLLKNIVLSMTKQDERPDWDTLKIKVKIDRPAYDEVSIFMRSR